jgi:hypothetical protein
MSSSSYASASPATPPERVEMGRLWRVGLLAIVAAAAANAVVWAVVTAVTDIPDEFMPLATVWPAVVFTALFLLVGLAVFALLVRFTRRPITWFWRVAIVALLLSFLTPLGARGQDGATTAGLLTLEVMHVVAFLVFVPLVTNLVRAK